MMMGSGAACSFFSPRLRASASSFSSFYMVIPAGWDNDQRAGFIMKKLEN
jgi:hypothetical protein